MEKHQEEEACHHLAVLLRTEARDDIFGGNVYGIIGREMEQLPWEGYEFYKRLFERAKDCGFSAWKLKMLFTKSGEGKKESCLKMIRKGNQIYRCPVSRMEAGLMNIRMDTDKLYDAELRRYF